MKVCRKEHYDWETDVSSEDKQSKGQAQEDLVVHNAFAGAGTSIIHGSR